jgi:hypothetical protein
MTIMLRAHFGICDPERLEGRALLSTIMPESEPNNRPRMADVVTLDAADGSALVVGTARAGDRDYFVVPIASPGTMTVALQVRGNSRATLKVDDAATGQGLFEGPAGIGMRSGTFNIAAGETLLVRVVGAGRGAGAYTLNLAQISAQQPAVASGSDVEPNDSMATANPVSLDASGHVKITGTVSSPSDVDFYGFTAPKSGRLTVIPDRTGAPVILRILDAAGRTKLTIYSDLPNFTASTQVVAGATYFVTVSPRMTTPAPYDLSLALV